MNFIVYYNDKIQSSHNSIRFVFESFIMTNFIYTEEKDNGLYIINRITIIILIILILNYIYNDVGY